jgi:hypothetical protein
LIETVVSLLTACSGRGSVGTKSKRKRI